MTKFDDETPVPALARSHARRARRKSAPFARPDSLRIGAMEQAHALVVVKIVKLIDKPLSEDQLNKISQELHAYGERVRTLEGDRVAALLQSGNTDE